MNKHDLDRMSPHLPTNTQQDRLVFFGGLLAMIVGAVALVTLAIGSVLKATGLVLAVLFLIVFVPYLLNHKGAIVNAARALTLIIVLIATFSVVSK